ncbi:paired box protein Pax-2-B-like [Vespula squamosa]|uniref:Paired box protein Pax-2-B-like n=1 Tax=Vespula squamosa TaxID=30214 RepID=A0ABD2B9J8_VESSQ
MVLQPTTMKRPEGGLLSEMKVQLLFKMQELRRTRDLAGNRKKYYGWIPWRQKFVNMVISGKARLAKTYDSVVRNNLLKDAWFDIINCMWFMHDGAPRYFSRVAKQFLNERFPNKWIAGSINWSA